MICFAMSTDTEILVHQERFLVVSGKKIKSIPVRKVAYFVADGRYIKMVTKSNERYLLDYSLESVGKRINPEQFFRVNRQYLIGFESITDMTVWSRGRIKIELDPAFGTEVITSIQNTAAFKKWLDR